MELEKIRLTFYDPHGSCRLILTANVGDRFSES